MKLSTKMHLLLPTLAVATVAAMTATPAKALDFDGDKPAASFFNEKPAEEAPTTGATFFGPKEETKKPSPFEGRMFEGLSPEKAKAGGTSSNKSAASFFNEEAPTTGATFFGPKEEAKPAHTISKEKLLEARYVSTCAQTRRDILRESLNELNSDKVLSQIAETNGTPLNDLINATVTHMNPVLADDCKKDFNDKRPMIAKPFRRQNGEVVFPQNGGKALLILTR